MAAKSDAKHLQPGPPHAEFLRSIDLIVDVKEVPRD
jgi:hypothetical protein